MHSSMWDALHIRCAWGCYAMCVWAVMCGGVVSMFREWVRTCIGRCRLSNLTVLEWCVPFFSELRRLRGSSRARVPSCSQGVLR
jgi:hypothetical protein